VTAYHDAVRAVTAPTRAEVVAAGERLAPLLPPTPVVPSPALGDAVFLKLETLQPTGAFKVRGGLAALALAPPGERVVASSAGNHGLGVAHAAALAGREATIVVPETASPAKIAALRRYPVELVVHGELYDDAERHALELAAERGRYVSPYNDPAVIAGQATLALELLRQVELPFTLVCPIGGGGLVSGAGLALDGHGVRIVGVESSESCALSASLAAGRIVEIEVGPTIADGLGGNLEPGSVTFELARRFVDEIVTVSDPELEDAMRFLASEHGVVAEAAGAAGVAALTTGRVRAGGRVVAVVTGRNVDPALFARILAG
jgi:threonine dehydratase